MPSFTSYINFSDPNAGSGGTVATAINGAGEIVGYYTDSNGTEHGFILFNGSFTDISDPNAGKKGTIVTGINAYGQIVGDYYNHGTEHGFIYGNGNFTDISDPNAGSKGTFVAGINASGEVVGNYYNSSGAEIGFTYSNGIFTDFSDLPGAPPTLSAYAGTVAGINNSGEVAGFYHPVDPMNGNSGGFVDNNGSFNYFGIIGIGHTGGGDVVGINNAGGVVGNYFGTYAAGAYRPPEFFIIHRDGQVTDFLSDPGASSSNPFNNDIGTFATAINNRGEVAGYYQDANGVKHGFVYEHGAFINFSDPDAGSGGTVITGINNHSEVVGYYVNSSGVDEGFIASLTGDSMTVIGQADTGHLHLH